jgi:hypothetical protein
MSTEGDSSTKTAKAVLVGAAMVALAILAAAGALVASGPSGVDMGTPWLYGGVVVTLIFLAVGLAAVTRR